MHTLVCTGHDNAHFPSLMYGFIMQQLLLYKQFSQFIFLYTVDYQLCLLWTSPATGAGGVFLVPTSAFINVHR